jgi:endonuclease YncB( thermonuclease family)
MIMVRTVAALLLLTWAHVGTAQTIVDAATVELAGKRMRLHGIDVSDKEQSCDGGTWFPREQATAALIKYVGDRKLDCFQVAFDYERQLPEALCYADKSDLQAFLVASGWAWVVRPGPLRYVDMERRAAELKLGVHGHQCQRADRWRRVNAGPSKGQAASESSEF